MLMRWARVRTWPIRGIVPGVLTVCVLLGVVPNAGGQVQWRSPGAQVLQQMSPREAALAIRAMVQPGQKRHVLVGFSESIGSDVREQMGSSGVELLAYVGEQTFFAVVDEPHLKVGRLAGVRSLRSVATIDRDIKLHPMLARGTIPAWAVVEHAFDATGAPDPVVGAYILFHRDVDLTVGSLLAIAYGAVVRDDLESINALVIELPFSSIALLAAVDSVQWIEPPLPPLVDLNDSNRILTEANIVQSPPYDLDGTGVTALIYDGGTALDSHNDFGGRLTVHDGSSLSDHATHTSGTVGGDGSSSGGQFRGMAPGVDLLSYGFQWDGQGIFLYSNPGDMENDYSEAINTLGADVANNSIGTNTESNGFDCAIQGDYGVTAVLIDTIVRGDGSNPLFDEPFRIIWSAGNERQGSDCDIEGFGDYYSTAPPACAKNHITIGALNSNNDSMTSFSSWGPVDDGRLKPDLSAPGCQSNDDGGVTSTSSAGNSAYSVKCGTSMSGPTVVGLTALLLEDFRAQFPNQPDPRNSTIKAILATTAEDRGNPGPDYQFGYGSVRIEAAINLMRSGDFSEGVITQGETQFFEVQVANPTAELKITLAWDDVPGTPNVDPALVNDLDLRITGPGGTFLPWTLDPGDPAANAVQNQADHLNNIEQVLIANPASGTWTVEVTGFDVPDGPQPFSLAGSGATNTGLFISLPSGAPDLLQPLTPTDIDVVIVAVGETIEPGTPLLHYSYDGGPFLTTPLQPQGGDLYRATLPAADCPDTPEFYFSAQGSVSGIVNNPVGAPTSTYSAGVGTETVSFADNFESDQGWTTENLGATSGDWQRGVPVNDPNWDHDPTSDGDGSGQAFVTQNENGNTDVDNGAVRLFSPILDMSADGITISYEYFLRLTNTSGDHLLVEISSNGAGGPWTVIADHNTDGGLSWRHHDITQADLDSAGVTVTSTMMVRFTANDADPQSINESGVDGFQVRTIACDAGLCGNGVVDPGEDCENCPADIQCNPDEECIAGVCEPLCGNGFVDPGEDCDTCPQDVQCAADEECIAGVCTPLCGNGVFDPGEDCANCPQDVQCAADEECIAGVCTPLCGNGVVDPGEDCLTCPQDVPCLPGEECIAGVCLPLCGNGVINPGEDCANCPQDVPCPPGTECVDGSCEPLCGNGVVDPGEDCANCPQDVGCAPGFECVKGVCTPLCGNGVADPGEDCANCPQDIPCPPGEECVAGVCLPLCGNGTVDPGEDCANCPQDVQCLPDEECVAGECLPLCGNGVFDPGEDCLNCPADIQCAPGEECIAGVCVPLCGNGAADPGEDCENCPQDVPCPPGTECINGMCEDLCGNGTADPGEDCANCPQDVRCPPGTECVDGMCEELCGNGVVDPGEDCANCPQDVQCPPGTECVSGVCQDLCGNGFVDPGEDCSTCPQDVHCPPGEECIAGVCLPLCGNGFADPGEDCENCPQDVQCPPGTECVSGVCQDLCGNGFVDPGEDCSTCPEDVPCPPGDECIAGVCLPLCGNGVINPGEDCENCPQDVPCPPGTECVGGSCEPLCGNGIVDPGENCANCPPDVQCPPGEECIAGVCLPLCGNGFADPGEDCENCPQDVPCPPGTECIVGMCELLCGNGTADPGEDCANCPRDIPCPPGTECVKGMCEALCGNGTVDPGEDCETCPLDVPCPPGTTCVNGLCECPWDLDGNGLVGITDFLDLLAAWGPNPGHPADFDGDGEIGINDFLDLLANWGPCG